MSSRAPLLEIRDLAISFPVENGWVQAVEDCQLSLRRGEVLGLVGESGSGKSITASACLDLVPPPGRVSGSLKLDGHELLGRSDKELRALRGGEIAMIFQNPMAALNPYFTIGRQMSDIVRQHRKDPDGKAVSKAEAVAIATAALEDVRLPDGPTQLKKYPHQLSGGQLQRVMIAIALSCQPRLLIADEPTTALDVTVQAQILLLLRQLVKEKDLTVLFITHDLGVVAELCDRVAVMYGGRIVEEGETARIFADPHHPYSQALLETAPELGQQSLRTIPGRVPDLSDLPTGCRFHPRCAQASSLCAQEKPRLRQEDTGPERSSLESAGRNETAEQPPAQTRSLACHHPLAREGQGQDAPSLKVVGEPQ
ncbi:ABC transporter ATP-binding protein [Rhodovibrionaceae bacterium A322]